MKWHRRNKTGSKAKAEWASCAIRWITLAACTTSPKIKPPRKTPTSA
jgi:hypothetical protein